MHYITSNTIFVALYITNISLRTFNALQVHLVLPNVIIKQGITQSLATCIRFKSKIQNWAIWERVFPELQQNVCWL